MSDRQDLLLASVERCVQEQNRLADIVQDNSFDDLPEAERNSIHIQLQAMVCHEEELHKLIDQIREEEDE